MSVYCGKTADHFKMSFRLVSELGLITWHAHWHYLANTVEQLYKAAAMSGSANMHVDTVQSLCSVE